MIDKDFLEIVATILGISHQTKIIGAFLNSFPSKFVLVSEPCKQCSIFKHVICIIVNCKRTGRNFGSKNHEVSNTNLAAPFLVN